MPPDDAVRTLQDRLRRYPADRYPVQHATAQFHLAQALLQAGDARPAATAVRRAVELFDRGALPVEHAKALNLLGTALRALGRPDDAAAAFRYAAKLFARRDRPLEQAAALFNLGLVTRDRGDPVAATEHFRAARGHFEERNLPTQASAAARELGASLLASGDLDAAAALEQAVAQALRAGDPPAVGLAANVLGVAHLAAGRPADAAGAFRQALAASPRRVRPDAYAMAKANLALAHERTGDPARARLAAAQALATPQAAEPVRATASSVLRRLGRDDGDLLAVLDDEPADGWPAALRDEIERWLDSDEDTRRDAAAALVRGQTTRGERGVGLAEAWLGVLLELPPAATETAAAAVVHGWAAADSETRERFASQVGRALPRFGIPQWLRLKDTFARLARDAGVDAAWG